MFRLLQNKRTQYTKNSGNKLSESALWIKQQVVEKARGKKQNPQWAKNMSAIFTSLTDNNLPLIQIWFFSFSRYELKRYEYSFSLMM